MNEKERQTETLISSQTGKHRKWERERDRQKHSQIESGSDRKKKVRKKEMKKGNTGNKFDKRTTMRPFNAFYHSINITMFYKLPK